MRSDSAYDALRELVVSGELRAGQRLTELELAARVGVSRTPIREALARLASEGFVAAEGRGVVVAELDADALAHAYRMRAALEALAAETAAERVREGEVAPAALGRLRAHADDAAAAVRAGRLADAIASNREFHRHVAELGANPLVLDALDRLWDRIYVTTRASLSRSDDHEAVIADQARLVDAIAAGDADVAGPLARAHVLTALEDARRRAPDAAGDRVGPAA